MPHFYSGVEAFVGDASKRGNVTLVEVGSRPSYLIYEHSLMVEQRSPKSSAWVRFLLFVFYSVYMALAFRSKLW